MEVLKPGVSLRRAWLDMPGDRKSTRLNSSHGYISYAVFCLKKKKHTENNLAYQNLVVLHPAARSFHAHLVSPACRGQRCNQVKIALNGHPHHHITLTLHVLR